MDLSVRNDEQRRAIRTLFRRPLILRNEHPEDFDLVRKNQAWTSAWFNDRMGWRLTLDQAAGFVRLFKHAAPDAARRRLITGEAKKPFTKREYVLLSLTLGILSRGEPQITIARLDEQLRCLEMPEGILPFEPQEKDERGALARVLQWLNHHGILRLRDGSADAYARNKDADGLYDVNGRLVTHMLGGELGPVMSKTIERFGSQTYPDTEDGANERLMHLVMRRLFDEPVLYFEDLTQEERTWLESKRHFLIERAKELGFDLERREEGIAAVDETASMTDDKFPSPQFSTVQHAAMKLIGHFLSEPWRTSGMAFEDIFNYVELLRKEPEAECWSTEYLDPEGRRKLARKLTDLLEDFGLLRSKDGRWMARPALWRYQDAPKKRKEDDGHEDAESADPE